MSSERHQLYPSTRGLQEWTLLKVARRLAPILAPGFDPPDTCVSSIHTEAPWDHDTTVERHGTKEAGFEVTKRSTYVERGSVSGDVQGRVVKAYGLPPGLVLELWGDHDSVTLVVAGPADAVAEIRGAFVGELAEKPTKEMLDHVRLCAHVTLARRAWDEALFHADVLLKHAPGDVAGTFTKGAALAAKGDLAGAEPLLEDVVRRDPGHVDAWYNLGNTMAALGRADRAVESYRSALQAKPGNHAVLCQLGEVLEACGRTDEAVAAYREAVATSPNPGGQWHYEGMDFTEKARAAVLRLTNGATGA